MSLEEKLSEFEAERKLLELEVERERPSFWRGFLKSALSPVGAGLLAGFYAQTLQVQGLCDISDVLLTGFGVSAAVGVVKELLYGTPPPVRHKNKIAVGAALLHVASWNLIDAESDTKLLFCGQYAVWQGLLSVAQLIQNYMPTSPISQRIRNYANILSAVAGGITFGYYGLQFNYGYKNFPFATFSLNATLAADAMVVTYAFLIGISALLDKQTYARVSEESRYWAHTLFGKKKEAARVLAQQTTTDLYVKAINAKRRAYIAAGQNRADEALLALADVAKDKKHAVDLVGRLLSAPQRLWQWQSSILSASGMLFDKRLRGAHELSLAVQNVIDGNYDFAFCILYKCEKYGEYPEAIALLSALVHERIGSPKTTAAYRYAAAKIALKEELFLKAGKSVHAKIIDTKKHAFLASNFVYYFGQLKDLTAQEQIRQRIEEVLDKQTTPKLVCGPLNLEKQAFSTYKYANGIPLAESRHAHHYHLAANILGRLHKLSVSDKPRDYRAVLTNRIATLEQSVSSSVIEGWGVLWKHLGQDYCFDRDSHGKNYYICNDKLIVLDFKPRQPNHRVLDIAKLVEHTDLFDDKSRSALFETYSRSSGVMPEFLSYLCAVPLVAFNSVYFHQQGTEPGFCENYLRNAKHAINRIKKEYPTEYENSAEEFRNIEQALTVAQKQVLSESPIPPTSAV